MIENLPPIEPIGPNWPQKRASDLGRTLKANARKIKNLRAMMGLSQAKLAVKARCSERTIANIEKGKAAYYETLSKIATALQLDVYQLLDEEIDDRSYGLNHGGRRGPNVHLQLILNIDASQFDETTHLRGLLELILQKVLENSPHVFVRRVSSAKEQSVRLDFDFEHVNPLFLLEAIRDDDLAMYRISKAIIEDRWERWTWERMPPKLPADLDADLPTPPDVTDVSVQK